MDFYKYVALEKNPEKTPKFQGDKVDKSGKAI